MVALRAWREEEAAVRARWGADAEIVRWTGVPAGYTLEDARLHGAAIESSRRRGRAIHFAIADASSDAVLGACDLRQRRDRRRGAEIGYLLGEAARGRGVMSHALTLMIGWAFDDLRLPCVQALVDPANTPSLRVLERLGFRRDAHSGAHRPPRGEPGDRVSFSFGPREWRLGRH